MINVDMGLREAKPLAVIEVWQQLKTHELKQQQIKCQGEIKSNVVTVEPEVEEKYAKQQKLHTYFANEHNQQTLTIATTTTTTTTINVQQRSKRKRSMHKALKCLKKCLTTLCFLCLFVSKITPTTIKTTTTTSTSTVTATILSLTSVLLHVPFIAASSLRTKNEQQEEEENMENKNYDIYFARPWTESLLGVEVEVETFTEASDSSGLDVVVNEDLEAQSTSNEQQLLAYYARAQKNQAQKYIENQQKSSAYDFDERVTKRAAAASTKRSIATLATIVSTPMNLTMDMPTITTKTSREFSPSNKNLESLSSVIGDGELTVQESTLMDDKCEPKVLNSVPMEPVS